MSKRRMVGRRRFMSGAAAGAAAFVSTPLAAQAPAQGQPAAAPPEAVYTTDRPGSDFMVDLIKSLGFEYAAANPGGTFLIFYGPAVYGAWRLLKGIIRFLRSADARTPTAWVMGATALAIAMLSVVGLIYATSNSETGSDATTRGGAPSRISTPPPTLDESLTNLKTGDCVKDPGESEFETLERTACGGGNVLRVINTFQITGHSDYPGTMRIAEIAEARCSYSATTYFEPTPGSWAVGDRLVVCVSD